MEFENLFEFVEKLLKGSALRVDRVSVPAFSLLFYGRFNGGILGALVLWLVAVVLPLFLLPRINELVSDEDYCANTPEVLLLLLLLLLLG